MTSRILITGGSGQLATALVEGSAPSGLSVQCVGRPAFDFDCPASIGEVFASSAPSLVVNTAAYTAVDAAEDAGDAVWRANRDGPAELARLCQAAGVPLIHISTDYVFDGLKGAPYVETDTTAPQCVYGASKLAGEEAILAGCERAVILRTSWVYSATGRNFVRTMLAAGQRQRHLRVVADQIGCPTSTTDLAQTIVRIAERIVTDGWDDDFRGVCHAAGTGATSWHQLAVATFDAASRHGFAVPEVAPIATDDWPTKARRPPDSRLDCSRLAVVFGLRLPFWRDGLTRTVEAICAG